MGSLTFGFCSGALSCSGNQRAGSRSQSRISAFPRSAIGDLEALGGWLVDELTPYARPAIMVRSDVLRALVATANGADRVRVTEPNGPIADDLEDGCGILAGVLNKTGKFRRIGATLVGRRHFESASGVITLQFVWDGRAATAEQERRYQLHSGNLQRTRSGS